MRGEVQKQSSMLCLVSPESKVPHDHPLRGIKKLADEALKQLSPVFDQMYAAGGRKSIPPERLLKALLLQALYSISSETQLCEQIEYNMLFRWFLDMDMVEDVFDRSTFTKNRERMLEHDVATHFFSAVREQARDAGLMSSEHFSVDGSLLQAWGSVKSFRPKDDDDQDNNGWGDFKGQQRKNETHESKTDPDAKLWRKGKGKEAKLSYGANALMENRNGLIVDFRIDKLTGTLETDVALEMIAEHVDVGATVGADKGFDNETFVNGSRDLGVTPHVAQNISSTRRKSCIDGRTTRHAGYQRSQVKRRLIEQLFGWFKAFGGGPRSRFRGVERTRLGGLLVVAAYNLLRMARLMPETA